MSPDKPTGAVGPIAATRGPTGVSGGWDKIQFPKEKEKVEAAILELWVAATRKAGGTILEVTKNSENDLDFTLVLPGGTVSLDLVEIIYRDGDGRPYESNEIEIKIFEFAEQIRDAVMKKSRHYGKITGRPIHLLMYITHWRFWPAEPVIRLVQHFLNDAPPIIENVFLVLPLTANEGTARVLYPSHNPLEGTARVLYPSHNPLEGADPSDFKDKVYWVLDPSRAGVVSSLP